MRTLVLLPELLERRPSAVRLLCQICMAGTLHLQLGHNPYLETPPRGTTRLASMRQIHRLSSSVEGRQWILRGPPVVWDSHLDAVVLKSLLPRRRTTINPEGRHLALLWPVTSPPRPRRLTCLLRLSRKTCLRSRNHRSRCPCSRQPSMDRRTNPRCTLLTLLHSHLQTRPRQASHSQRTMATCRLQPVTVLLWMKPQHPSLNIRKMSKKRGLRSR